MLLRSKSYKGKSEALRRIADVRCHELGLRERGGSGNVTARNVICRDHLSLTRASLSASSDRFRWGEAKGRAERSGQVRRIGEARVHGGCPHQFTGSYLARGMLER
jgi:hypothetical protein